MKTTVRDLASLLAKLSGTNVAELVRALNIPPANWQAWLAGSSNALRMQDLLKVMAMLGLDLRAGKFWLSSSRVHFWTLTIPPMGSVEDALAPLVRLSPWMSGCAITRVAEAKGRRGFLPRTTDTWFIGSREGTLADGEEPVSVVVRVVRPVFRSAEVSPSTIRGASWLYDDKRHALLLPASVMRQVEASDLTVAEFKRIFAGDDATRAASWEDVALAARQFNIAPDDLIALIRREYDTPGPDVPSIVSNLIPRGDMPRPLRAVGAG